MSTTPRAHEYHKGKRFSTYELGYGPIQLRDNRAPRKTTMPGPCGIVAVFPTLGGQWATQQTHAEAKRLARKVCRMLNAS